MRIALFPSAYHPAVGGVEEATRHLGRQLVALGHHVLILTERWPRHLPAVERIEGIDVHRIPFRTPANNLKSQISYPLTHHRIRAKVRDVLGTFRPDLLHVQCIGGNAFYARLAKEDLHLPLFVTTQGDLSLYAGTHYLNSRFMDRELPKVIRAADYLTACSQHTLEEMVQAMGSNCACPTQAILNGISLQAFERQAPYQHHRPYILGLGRLIHKKGFDLLLKAYAIADLTEHDLIIAGAGEEETALKALATKLSIQDRVHFFGMANREQVRALFQGCAFYVLPSRKEPQGIVLLEAMAAEKATLASRVGGIPEVLVDNETGLLVSPEDVKAIAKALQVLADNPQACRRMGLNARRHATQFDWALITETYIEAYKKCLNECQQTHPSTP